MSEGFSLNDKDTAQIVSLESTINRFCSYILKEVPLEKIGKVYTPTLQTLLTNIQTIKVLPKARVLTIIYILYSIRERYIDPNTIDEIDRSEVLELTRLILENLIDEDTIVTPSKDRGTRNRGPVIPSKFS